MSRNPKDIVRDGYDCIAARYNEWTQDSLIPRRFLARLLPFVPDGANILDLGCGAGLSATRALSAHGTVTGVDISKTQIALAKSNVPDANFICADMVALDFPLENFSTITAFCALTHLPRDEHAAMVAKIFGWLKPGGVFLATFGAEDLPDYFDENWLGAPNFFSHFDATTNLGLVRDAGFEIVEDEIAQQDVEGEADVSFLWVIARKPHEYRSSSHGSPTL